MLDAFKEVDAVYTNARLATMDPAHAEPFGLLDDYAIVVRGDQIVDLVPSARVPINLTFPVHDLKGKWVTPGLIDCHTHAIYAGSRYADWNRRLGGQSYSKIAEQGGGILSTVSATRSANEEQLLQLAMPRLQALYDEGVTCIEIKSGYGLTLNDELKMLRVARALSKLMQMEISATLLAAHTVPSEYRESPDRYVDLIVEEIIPETANQNLAEAVDVFCEHVGFTVDQSNRIWEAARRHGFAVKGHVEQLSNQHGTVALSQYQPWSADHIEYLDDEGVESLARCHAVGVLLPGAYYFLREKQKPPVDKLRQAGVPMAVASDLNPGTSPFASLRLAMNMACVLFGLTPEDVLAGVTRVAAQALGRADRLGSINVGKQADFLIWDIDHPSEIVLSLGLCRPQARVIRGRLIDHAA